MRRRQGQGLSGPASQVRTREVQPASEPLDHKYEVIIYWSREDDVFVAEVPELPGCTAHGPTPADALASVQQAATLWVDTAREFGDPIPEPKCRRLMLA